MFEHYLPNKNESATVAPRSKFRELNKGSIDGNTDIAFTEDVLARYEALGWHTIWVKNGNTGYDDIRAAIKEAKGVKDKPTLIKVTGSLVILFIYSFACHFAAAP